MLDVNCLNLLLKLNLLCLIYVTFGYCLLYLLYFMIIYIVKLVKISLIVIFLA